MTSPSSSQAELLAGPSQSELLGPAISRTYGGSQGMGRLPAWYGLLCEQLSRDLALGRISREQASRLLDIQHPLALDQLGRSRDAAATLVGRGRNQRTHWPARDPRLDAEQAILADLAALVAGGLARVVPIDGGGER